MKKFKLLFVFLIFLLASCTAEELKNVVEQIKTDETGKVPGLVGSYALDDGSGLSDAYVSFDNQTMYEYRGTPKVLADGYFWNTQTADFIAVNTGAYSVSNNILYCKGVPYGNIVIGVGNITLDNQKYTKISGFKKERYSTISLQGDLSRTVPYQKQTLSIPVAIDRKLASAQLSVQCFVSWINSCAVKDGILSFTVQENETKESRSAEIVLSYLGAADVTLRIIQDSATSRIVMSPAFCEVGYTGETNTFSFSIENPHDGVACIATSQSDWIKDVRISGNTVSYKVVENNDGSKRTGTIRLTYGDYAVADFVVNQLWQSASIRCTPVSQSVSYSGGNYSFEVSVENPRDGVACIPQSQANWITNVIKTGDTVSYQVAENNTGSARTGIIKVNYGNLDSKDFTVVQAYVAPEISFVPSSQSIGHTSGEHSFEVRISNPRANAGLSCSRSSEASSWIISSGAQDNLVTYKVLDNTSAKQRTGMIRVYYGLSSSSAYCYKDFSLTQQSAPVDQLSLNKTSLELLPGDSEKLIPTVNPSDAILQWSSSASTVATVENGLVKAVGNGTATITLKAMSESGNDYKTATCQVSVITPVTGVSLNMEGLDLNVDESKTLVATIAPSTANNKALSWSSNNTSVATVDQDGKVTGLKKGTAGITVTTADGNKIATCQVWVGMYVDMGLSVKWASENIGATKAEEYGSYLNFNDAVKIKLGKRRVATDAEWTELRLNCAWTWTTLNSVNGYRVTSPQTGNSIFLPAAGYRNYDGSLRCVGTYGYYWSSTIYSVNTTAWEVDFNSSEVKRGCDSRYSSNLNYGYSVRPVTEY